MYYRACLVALAAIHCTATSGYENEWSSVRGVNYVPSYSRNPVQTWMDYDRTTVERELGYANKLGLNAVRTFLHLYPWQVDPDTFLSNYDHFVSACAARSIKPLVVLFDDDFYDAPVNTSSQIAAYLRTGAYKTANWMANPGMPLLGTDVTGNFTLEISFVMAIAGGARSHDHRVLGYDVMNEPHRTAPFAGGLSLFISTIFKVLHNITDVQTTVDEYPQVPAGVDELERGLSFHSYWNYGHWQSCATSSSLVCKDQAAAGTGFIAKAAALNKPVLVSEMGQFDCYCSAAQGFMTVGVGWIAWELMLEHDQFSSFQGLVYKNGTSRSSSEADCLRKLAASAGSVPPCPTPPRPDGCAAANCSIMADSNTSFFKYTPPSTSIISSCWTAWHGSGPEETHGSLHYCNKAGSTVTFTLPDSFAAADLIYKAGPDCGMFNVTSGDGKTHYGNVDAYADSVTWERSLSIVPFGHTARGSQNFTVTVAEGKNPRSTNSWVQIVAVNIFAEEYRPELIV